MDEKLFYCYSHRLKKFLDLHDMKYESKGAHKVTGKPYYLYVVTDNLDKVLKMWGEYKKNFERI